MTVYGIAGQSGRDVRKTYVERGFTLIEMAVVIVMVMILCTFGVLSWMGISETSDASLVQSVQSSLQAIVAQASVRQDRAPTFYNSTAGAQNVVNAVKVNISQKANLAAGGGGYVLSIANSSRGATYSISANGDVCINSVSNFTRFQVNNCLLEKI